ncbi:aquaporin [Streptomyces sp. NPDC018031]|uniref:aquaporin n=1 Tax=Streptomyces sp. NPDC018031 TaxID=3365033 RepID=UPI0037AC7909
MSASVPPARAVAAEFVGTAALAAVVVGSGIQAAALSADVGVRLLANSLATVFGLGGLIALLGPVSGAHFNPVVTLAAWWSGRRGGDGPGLREVAAYLPAQTAGAVCGAELADAMFAEPLARFATQDRFAGHLWLGEAVATCGLVLMALGLARAGLARLVPVVVAGYIGAAIWFTSSGSFANPALTVGRSFTDTFTGIAPGSVAPFVAAQFAGALAGVALVALLFGRPAAGDAGGEGPADPRGGDALRAGGGRRVPGVLPVAPRTLRTGRAGHTDRAGHPGRTGRTDRTGRTGRTDRTGRAHGLTSG